jgi:hypothetical protein
MRGGVEVRALKRARNPKSEIRKKPEIRNGPKILGLW